MIRYLFARYRKAIAAAVGAGVLAIAGAYFVVSPGHITSNEWYDVILAMVGGAGGPAVAKPNAPKRNQAGRTALALVVVVAALGGVLAFTASAAQALHDTNWPCAGCVTTHR